MDSLSEGMLYLLRTLEKGSFEQVTPTTLQETSTACAKLCLRDDVSEQVKIKCALVLKKVYQELRRRGKSVNPPPSKPLKDITTLEF